MKLLTIIFSLLAVNICLGQAQASLSLNNLFEAEEIGYLDPPDRYTTLGSALLIAGDVAFPWGEYTLGGVYLNFSPGIEVFRTDENLTAFEIGLFFGGSIPVFDEEHEIRPVVQFGYRSLSSSDGLQIIDGSDALGVNMKTSFIINRDNDIAPVINIGFIAQPTGGNDDIFFSFSPQWYIGAGVIVFEW